MGWAYLHPRAVHIFERQWLVNLILWGNFARLRDAALQEMGDVIFIDYHRPVLANPFRYLMVPILSTLESFAMDLWRGEIADCLPAGVRSSQLIKQTYFGGLYQKVVITR